MDSSGRTRVLIVANKASTTPQLLRAMRLRAEAGPATFHLLVPDPGHGGWRPSDAGHPDVTEGEQVLALALPVLEEAAPGAVTGSTSVRHDPMDAVEELLAVESYDEILLSTLPHHVSMWLHVDLPRRLGHLGLPVTTVTPYGVSSAGAAR